MGHPFATHADAEAAIHALGATRVTSFGAVGDGVTDDTAAFAAAIAAGVCVDVPAGTYLVGSLSTAGNTVLRLDPHATLKLKDGSNNPLLWAGTGDRLRVYGGTLDGNAAGQTTAGPAIYLSNGADGCEIVGVTIRDTFDSAVQAWNTFSGRVADCTIINPLKFGVVVHADSVSGDGWIVRGNRIDRTGVGLANATGGGVRIGAANGSRMSGAVIADNQILHPEGNTAGWADQVGIRLWAGGGDNAAITGNYVYAGSTGVDWDSANGVTMTGNTVAGCSWDLASFGSSTWNTVVSGNTFEGVYRDGTHSGTKGVVAYGTATHFTISGNAFIDCGGMAVLCQDTVRWGVISNNIIRSTYSDKITPGWNCQIDIRNGTTDIQIGGNTIDGNNGGGRSTMSGIYVEGQRINITGNSISGCTSGTYFSPSGDSPSNLVLGNHFDNVTVAIDGASTTVMKYLNLNGTAMLTSSPYV